MSDPYRFDPGSRFGVNSAYAAMSPKPRTRLDVARDVASKVVEGMWDFVVFAAMFVRDSPRIPRAMARRKKR